MGVRDKLQLICEATSNDTSIKRSGVAVRFVDRVAAGAVVLLPEAWIEADRRRFVFSGRDGKGAVSVPAMDHHRPARLEVDAVIVGAFVQAVVVSQPLLHPQQ